MSKIFRGQNAKILKDSVEIGLCQSVTLDIDPSLLPYYEIGVRTPKILKEGPREISGTLEKVIINKDWFEQLTTLPPVAFDLVLQISTEVGAPIIYLYNCYLKSGRINIETGDVILESYDFIATDIALYEISSP